LIEHPKKGDQACKCVPERNLMPEPKSKSIATESNQPTPVLSLRDVVVYPYMVIPLFVGRERSILALDKAMDVEKRIVLVTQRSAEVDDPSEKDLFKVGTLATVLQLLKLPDGTTKVLVEGGERVRITEYTEESGFFEARWELVPVAEEVTEKELEITMRSLVSLFEQYVKLNRKIPPELLTTLAGIDDPSRLADTVAAHLAIRLEEKQVLLEMGSPRRRMEHLMALVEGEIDVLQLEKRIRGRVKTQMEKSQREYYLNEQMKAIQKELGDMDDAPNDLEDLERRIADSGMSKEAEKKATSELNKLKMMSPMSAEATVVRNYIDWMLNVPWKKRSRIRKQLDQAEEILEADHYGLEKVKERILEYLAVQQRVRQMKGPILCLVGPPGVGKTSLADPSPAPLAVSLSACHWAGCVTRLKYAVIAVPISVPCRAGCCRTWPKWEKRIHCSCWMNSTRCPWISAAIHLRLCSKCSIRSKTIPSTTTTWRSISICRK